MSTDTASRPSALTWLAILLGAAAMAFLIHYHITHRAHGAPPSADAGEATALVAADADAPASGGTDHADDAAHSEGEHHDGAPPWWGFGILPFVAILTAIAIFPLLPFTHRWWESNQNRFIVSITCAGMTLVYYWLVRGSSSLLPVLDHAVPGEYVPFIVLLFSLYVISGGINLRGDLAARPATNTAFLAFGALIASFIGTTGASMLLIRPILQTNRERKRVVHTVVFFIFLVSNIGGTLLPIGDPPLFLGYLRGVSFFWTVGLWPEWAFCCIVLLVVYYVWDTMAYRKERPEDVRRDETQREPLRLRGVINILWLAGVVACVAFVSDQRPLPGTSWTPFPFLRETLMLGLVGLSLLTTSAEVRKANHFTYFAILEVAALFIGIFIAMQVPIDVLKASGATLQKAMNQPWHFFWATGGLSSFLDNAPTYVVFFELGRSIPAGETAVLLGPDGSMGAISEPVLSAISLGAVFMGSMTYIGNGPNFMVKAIAEQAGVHMPSFFGYVVRYSFPILVPLFIVITLIFLGGETLPAPAP
jgi:Na+/H+ antiporter NhaD/arsenite permease-like protein